MKKIKLTTKKELSIYMNPVRQQLLRQLEIGKAPMTPKMLADKLDISASGVQHHIKKLMSLELIELDHTELINGITASFYKPTYATVQIGLENNDDTTPQREVLLQDKIAQVFEGFRSKKKKVMDSNEKLNIDALQQLGDILTDVVHLTDQESKELLMLVTEYIEGHTAPATDRTPWEYALILYNAKEDLDD
jgi:hypothetical protein